MKFTKDQAVDALDVFKRLEAHYRGASGFIPETDSTRKALATLAAYLEQPGGAPVKLTPQQERADRLLEIALAFEQHLTADHLALWGAQAPVDNSLFQIRNSLAPFMGPPPAPPESDVEGRMTEKAGVWVYAQFRKIGWSNSQLVAHGYMLNEPPLVPQGDRVNTFPAVPAPCMPAAPLAPTPTRGGIPV